MKEDIVFSASIDKGGEGAKSLKALKQEFKDIQQELNGAIKGTDTYRTALSKLANVKDEIEDLNDEIKGFQGAGKFQAFSNVASSLAGGFQAATGAAALFGAESEEVSKALLKIQAAMALTDGLKSLEGMKDSLMVVGNVIKTNVVTAFSTLKGAIAATGIGALVIAIGVLIYKTQEYNAAIDEEYDKQKRLNEELKKTTDEYLKQAIASENLRNARKGGLNELERELNLLVAQGATADEIAAKKQAILDKEIFNLKVRRSTIEGDAAMEAQLTEEIKDKENEKTALILANQKRIKDEAEKARLERKRQAEKDFEDALAQQKAQDDEFTRQNLIDKQRAKEEQAEFDRIFAEQDAARLKQEEADREQEAKNEEFKKGFYERENARLEEKIAREEAAAKQIADLKLQVESKSFEAAQALSDLFFSVQLNKAKGNAARELELRKKQFNVEKAFNVARATIDGIRSVQAALIIPPPFGQILAVANGVIAAANVAKIASQKFDGGGSGAASTPSTPSAAPSVQTQAPTITTPETRLNEQGQNLTIKAEVVETESTRAQNRVKRLENQATFG